MFRKITRFRKTFANITILIFLWKQAQIQYSAKKGVYIIRRRFASMCQRDTKKRVEYSQTLEYSWIS